MKLRKYIFVVAFVKNKKLKLLALHRKKNWRGWELLKGGLMDGETEQQCLKREIEEETGAKKYKIFRTRHRIKYRWPKTFIKDHHKFQGADGKLYIVQLFNEKIKIDKKEHDKFKWLDRKDILKYLTYLNQRKAVKYVLKNHKL
jgi:8-oxo-dGTP pyrophosphatase MutT (NUDIX family)